jgi:NAD(P)H-flavin reductase
MQLHYEDECRALLEASESGGVESENIVGGSVRKVKAEGDREEEEEDDNDDDDDDGEGLSIRSYRPFKVLQKRYLSENTLLVVCDLPYSSKKKSNSRATNSRTMAYAAPTMFHLLIRFQQPDGQYLTKAFTPVDMSRLHTTSRSASGGRGCGGGGGGGGDGDNDVLEAEVDGDDDVLEAEVGGVQGFEDRMAFLVKLYPSPHATSEMFRALEVYTESVSGGGVVGDDTTNNINNRKGVLFLRGPIQTGQDRQKNQQQQQQQQLGNKLNAATGGTKRKRRKRIVMIAAGSGITPMYQVLRALHDQQQRPQHSLGVVAAQEEGGDGQFWEADEVDLVYCNRTTDDIWLRQELQSIGVSHGQEEGGEEISEMTAGLSLVKRTAVRVQHVLSSSSPSVNQITLQGRGGNHQFHEGRITLDLLSNTLQQKDQVSAGRQEDREEEQLQILICGPPLFNKDVSDMLALLEYHNSDTCEIHILE